MRHFGGVFTFLVSWRNHDVGGRTGHPWRAQRAIFSRISTFLNPKTQNFLMASMAMDGHGHILSSSGAKSLPRLLTLGILNDGPRVYFNFDPDVDSPARAGRTSARTFRAPLADARQCERNAARTSYTMSSTPARRPLRTNCAEFNALPAGGRQALESVFG